MEPHITAQGAIPDWLRNEVAVVTGAGSGIGRAIANYLAGAGAHVVVVDRDEAAAQATVDGIGHSAEALTLDITDSSAVATAFAAIADRHGRIDVLVNNAGVYPMLAIDELDDATWDRVLSVNLRGAFTCMREAARRMESGGRIVNISSIDSLRPSAVGLGHYGASKAALNALTRSAAVEYGPLGLRVNALLPGVIATEGTSATPDEQRREWASRTPVRRLGTPEDIAGAVLFLVSPFAAFVQGHGLVVDGGITISA